MPSVDSRISGSKPCWRWPALEKSEPRDSEKIAFQVAPRLNAAGRLRHANLAVELLLTNSARSGLGVGRRASVAESASSGNGGRPIRRMPGAISSGRLGNRAGVDLGRGRLASGHHRDCGGADLAERLHRPVVLIGPGPRKSPTGRGFSTSEAAASMCLLPFRPAAICCGLSGGHPGAAGFTLWEDEIPKFRETASGSNLFARCLLARPSRSLCGSKRRCPWRPSGASWWPGRLEKIWALWARQSPAGAGSGPGTGLRTTGHLWCSRATFVPRSARPKTAFKPGPSRLKRGHWLDELSTIDRPIDIASSSRTRDCCAWRALRAAAIVRIGKQAPPKLERSVNCRSYPVVPTISVGTGSGGAISRTEGTNGHAPLWPAWSGWGYGRAKKLSHWSYLGPRDRDRSSQAR